MAFSSVFAPSLLRVLVIGLRTHPNQDHLIKRAFIISAKALCSNKLTVPGSRWTYLGGGAAIWPTSQVPTASGALSLLAFSLHSFSLLKPVETQSLAAQPLAPGLRPPASGSQWVVPSPTPSPTQGRGWVGGAHSSKCHPMALCFQCRPSSREVCSSVSCRRAGVSPHLPPQLAENTPPPPRKYCGGCFSRLCGVRLS